MKNKQKILCSGFIPTELSRAPHMVCLADFNTSHPNLNRINRIANEINDYLKYKNKEVSSILMNND